jgi:type I restriction enzyme S subunit
MGDDVRVISLREAVELNPKPDRSMLTDDTEVSFVPMAAVEAASGRMDASTIRRYAEVKKGYTHFRDGDVLFAKITPCMENGKMAVAHSMRNGIGLGSTEFHVLRAREGVDPHYVYHFVSSGRYRSEAAHHMTGAVGQKRVPLAFLEQSEIPLPDIGEQRRIVAEIEKQFSRLDEAVAGLQHVKANLKRYKAAILNAAVEGRLVPTEADLARREGRNYETGAQLLHRILETRRSQWQGKGKYKEPAAPDTTDLPELPEGWVMSNGAQLFRWSSGVNLPVKTLVGGPISVYGGNGINGGHSEANVPHKTVVIGRVGAGCGNVHLIDRPAWITDNAIYATWTPTDCNLSYLANVFLVANLNTVAAGSGQPFVNQTILNDVLVPLPPLAEQHRIVAEVDRLLSIAREAEVEVETNLKRAQALRQTILSVAFSNRKAIT